MEQKAAKQAGFDTALISFESLEEKNVFKSNFFTVDDTQKQDGYWIFLE